MEEYKNNLENSSEQETKTDWDTLQKMDFEKNIDKARAEAEAANKVYDSYASNIEDMKADLAARTRAFEFKANISDSEDEERAARDIKFRQGDLRDVTRNRDERMEVAASEAGENYVKNKRSELTNSELFKDLSPDALKNDNLVLEFGELNKSFMDTLSNIHGNMDGDPMDRILLDEKADTDEDIQGLKDKYGDSLEIRAGEKGNMVLVSRGDLVEVRLKELEDTKKNIDEKIAKTNEDLANSKERTEQFKNSTRSRLDAIIGINNEK
jgi:hypothetical protein